MSHDEGKSGSGGTGEGTTSAVKQALLKIGQLRARIAELEQQQTQPIAIVGAGVRAPGGVSDLDGLWALLREGRCSVGPVPASRWDAEALYDPRAGTPGAVYTRHGSFIESIDTFDAAFFHISGREAEQMDPQQRLLLEVSWEALENAAIDPGSLHGRACGVFIGLMNQDYADRVSGAGTSASVASGRIAYVLGLQGPAMTVDTACSSSLVSLHLACKSLARGECELALAGGVNLQVSAKMTLVECAGQMLSVDGRCKTFDAAADGFGRSDGCVVLVLKRLDRAQADGDPILAVVRGSAVNHDGASGGLTVPNGPAQQRVLRAALADAGLNPSDVDFIEAHGTGTSLGDPIELAALASVYGGERTEPLWVASVKTNFGHMEAAAGAIGVLKAALALKHGELPPHLHLTQPNPHFDWDAECLRVPQQAVPWSTTARPRRAGVSAFGISGTNAHVVLEQAPLVRDVEEPTDSLVVKLAAATPEALRALAAAHAEHLITRLPPAAAVQRTLNRGRADFPHRLAVSADNIGAVASALRAHAAGETAADLHHGTAAETLPVAWLFTGQGAQYAGMGAELYRQQPTFRRAFDDVADALRAHLDVAPDVLMFDRTVSRIDDTRYAQPALFALQYSLARWWQAAGLMPAAVLGHSVGEFAAACIAGVFDLADAAMLIAARARLMSACNAPGGMAVVFAPAEAIELPADDSLVIAAFNGPRSTVISGDLAALQRCLARLEANGVSCQRLSVSHAFHSPLMEPMRAAFADCAARVSYRPATLPLVSTVSGTQADARVSSAAYWVDHVFAPVRFAQAIETLVHMDVRHTLELGPQPHLSAMLHRCANTEAVTAIPTLRRDAPELRQLHRAVAALYVAGASPNWRALESERACALALPTYRFQRQRYWLDEKPTELAPRTAPADYDLRWDARERPASAGVSVPRLLIGAATTVSDWQTALIARGEACDALQSTDQIPARLAEVRETGQRTDVLVICSGDANDSQRLLASLQGVAGADALRIWAIDSRNTAQPDRAVALAQVAATELQANWGALLVVPQGASDIDPVLAEVAAEAGEDAVRLEGEERRVRRLYRREASPGESAAALDPAACYWISGGTGGMGIAAAEALIARGTRHLTLISRRGETGCVDSARQRLEAWRARGIHIDVLAIDITHAAAVAASLERQDRPVRGLIHAAGVEDYALLAALTPERLDSVLRPKVDGLEVLVTALASQPLDFVLAVSSVAAIWGGVGSLHYAAANAWIDAWARAGKASGKPYVSLRLGPVSGTGMMDAARSAQLRQSGLITLHRSRAIDAIDRALTTTHAVVTACDLDEDRFQTALQLRRSRPLLDALRPAGAPGAALRNDRWRMLSVAQREADIWTLLERGLREVLRLSEAVEIPPDRPAQHLGIDSLLAIEVRDRLAALFELVLPTTFVYDHPTPAAMHAQLLAMLVSEVGSTSPVASAAPDSGARDIAVIGMACRFPGGANDPEQFWQLLQEGRCAIDDAPERFDAARWKSLDRNEPDRAYTVSAGLIDDVDLFAADFFGIPAHEALCMDPQHRLVLETAWETIERAGYRPDLPALRRTGVFVGIGVSEYGDLLLRDPRALESAALVPPGNCINAAAGRVSFVFDFHGPSIAVDTACSSSLVALQQAVEALRRGDCDYALAGGVTLALNPEILVLLCKGNMLGERGRCAAFSADADGYVRGEGCGMLLLKPLAAAQRDGDPILGLVRGCAVNQNGRSGSLTVPNGSAQQAVLRAALADAGVSADRVGHVEAHGTGTPLGDPVELHAIAAVYGAAPRAAPLQVGAVKSNIGHLEAAAGIAGVIKSLLCLQHGQWVPSLHFSALNPNIQIDQSVVRICTDAAPVLETRLAAVSSFGFSGTNAHVILAPAPPDERRPEGGSPDLFVLSARSPAELRGHAARMRDWLTARPLSLAAVCATVRHSRAGIGDHRLAIACQDMAGLIADLAAFVDGRTSPTQCQAQQRQRRARFTVETVGESGGCPDALASLPATWRAHAAAWLDGWSVEWPASPIPRVTLPAHPWRRERFWPVSSAAGFPVSDSRLPGRRVRVPGSTDFRYVVPVTEQQPAHVRDHRIFGEVLLAGASHVAAILCAARASLGARPLLLRDIAFEEAMTPGSRVLQWQIALQPVGDHFTAASYSYSADDEQEAAVRHLSAELHLPEHDVSVEAARRPTTPANLDGATLYATLDSLGYRLGASFRWLAQGWRTSSGTLWQLSMPPLREAASDFVLYPGLIDSCFIAVGECIGSRANAGSDVIFVPFSVAEVVVWRSPRADEALWCQVWADPIDTADGVPDQASGGATLFGANGDVIARIGRFRARQARRDALHQRITGAARQLGHRWTSEAVAADETPDTAATDEAVARCEATLLDAVRTSGDDAHSEALAYCIALVGSVTAQPVEKIDSRRSPTSLGVDSLMAIDLRRRLMHALGIDLDAVAILDAADLAELAARVLNRLNASLGTARSTDAAAGARASLSSVVEVEI